MLLHKYFIIVAYPLHFKYYVCGMSNSINMLKKAYIRLKKFTNIYIYSNNDYMQHL